MVKFNASFSGNLSFDSEKGNLARRQIKSERSLISRVLTSKLVVVPAALSLAGALYMGPGKEVFDESYWDERPVSGVISDVGSGYSKMWEDSEEYRVAFSNFYNNSIGPLLGKSYELASTKFEKFLEEKRNT